MVEHASMMLDDKLVNAIRKADPQATAGIHLSGQHDSGERPRDPVLGRDRDGSAGTH